MSIATRLLPKRAQIERNVPISNSQGGWTDSLQIQANQIPCRVRPSSILERQVSDQESVRVTHVIYFADGVDVQVADEVEVTPIPAKRYTIVAVREPSKPGHHIEVDAYLYQKGV